VAIGANATNVCKGDAASPTGLTRATWRSTMAEHYQPVGEALLWTLEKGLGADFTLPVKAAWTEAYKTLSGVMIAAAYPQ
jgi:hemoglobin-like flavoprotein